MDGGETTDANHFGMLSLQSGNTCVDVTKKTGNTRFGQQPILESEHQVRQLHYSFEQGAKIFTDKAQSGPFPVFVETPSRCLCGDEARFYGFEVALFHQLVGPHHGKRP